MKRLFGIVVSFLTIAAFQLNAGTSVNFSLSASTGDSDFDLTLRNINLEAKQSLPSYYTSMRINFGASSDDIDRLLYHHKLSPADAFMVFRISIMIGKPIDHIVVAYSKHKGKGWGAVAKSLGIKPGSAQFHKLKQEGVVVLDRSKKERTGLEVQVTVGSDGKGHGARDVKKAGGKSSNQGKGKGRKK